MMNSNLRPFRRTLAGVAACAALLAVLLLGLAWLAASPAALAQDAATPQPDSQRIYRVQVGDSWISVAARNGVSVAELQAANPQSLRPPNNWLLVGEQIIIPTRAAPVNATGTITAAPGSGATQRYTVGVGESWNSIAQKFGVSATVLQAANPRSVRAGLVLYRGEELVIPPVGGTEADLGLSSPTPTTGPTPVPPAVAETATPEATAMVTASEAPTEEATEAATETPTDVATSVATEAPAEEATATATAAPQEEPAATEVITATAPLTTTAVDSSQPPPCPTEFAAYPDLLAALINAPYGGAEGLLGYLRSCNALDENGVTQGDWNGDGADDLAVVLVNPASDAATPETDLLIFMSDGERYTLAYRARAAGQIKILATEDVNADGKPDIVWTDTTCGANTCFDTVNVRSWDGTQWADWTNKTITMAYGEVSLVDARDTAQGQEIKLVGGVYGSVGAGPQRGRTEFWGSIGGAPYSLTERVYDRSTCLYHKVLDANEALQRYQEIGLVQAREMYTEAVTNRNLTKCWQHDDELEELRSFSLFRLALIAAYEGKPDAAADNVAQLQQAYPDSIYTGLAEAWLAAYQPANDIPAACAAATEFATANPQTFERLSDYGYANPTFLAGELCPVLAIDVPAAEGADVAVAAAVTATEGVTVTSDVTVTTEVTAAITPEVTDALPLTGVLTTPDVPGSEGDLPACPASLNAYAEAMPQVIEVSASDPLIIETWLRLCDGMADDRGGLLLDDFNGDSLPDALFLPTIVSDLGFGPQGTQGAVLVYHGQEDGTYSLVSSPEIYGQPTLVATGTTNDDGSATAGDVNGDGRKDLAWAVEGCSTFCVKEVQIVTWDPDQAEYVAIIDPGATIAEGTVTFEELPAGALGQGKQLVLAGGVSGTTDGGLAVEHTELWQTVNGQPFRRLSWTYDRETPGNDCLGLRLIEADVALQASDLLGFAPAAALYQGTLDPALRACSIYGIPADQELLQLRGLAAFRLIQTQALSGTLDAAQQTLATLTAEQPETSYTRAATQWLAEYERAGSAQTACAAVQTIFDRDTVTWQVTDHFGYNHPALAPEQVCFVPREVAAP